MLVAVLNHAEWFSLRKGGAADPVPFVVRLASGKEYHYQAIRYQHGEGAALVSRSPSDWENGQVFCRKLPASLAKAGVTLPPCFTYFGERQHCAPDYSLQPRPKTTNCRNIAITLKTPQ
jgi:hypothetical protein